MLDLKKVFESAGVQIDIGEVSDGFHTFNSLYHQRLILFAALCNTFKDVSWKSKKHSDGEVPFGGGWFVVGIDTPEGQYTYHYELKDWDLFKCKELEKAPEWDGHTDQDVERLLSLSKGETMTPPEFDRSFGIIDPEQMEIVKSEYGNRYVSITPEDILALITGKVLFVEDGEYTTFVKLTD